MILAAGIGGGLSTLTQPGCDTDEHNILAANFGAWLAIGVVYDVALHMKSATGVDAVKLADSRYHGRGERSWISFGRTLKMTWLRFL